MDLTKLKPGDTLWHVEAGHYSGIPPGVSVTVEKVGRAWLTLVGGLRVYRKTGQVEPSGFGYGSGAIYRDEREYLANVALGEAWREFAGCLPRFTAPEGMTLEKIKRIKEIMDENT